MIGRSYSSGFGVSFFAATELTSHLTFPVEPHSPSTTPSCFGYSDVLLKLLTSSRSSIRSVCAMPQKASLMGDVPTPVDAVIFGAKNSASAPRSVLTRSSMSALVISVGVLPLDPPAAWVAVSDAIRMSLTSSSRVRPSWSPSSSWATVRTGSSTVMLTQSVT